MTDATGRRAVQHDPQQDYIMHLERENAALAAEVREWLCASCQTVYPGPPTAGCACVVCPHCGGTTGPRRTIEWRALEVEREQLRGVLRGLVTSHDSTENCDVYHNYWDQARALTETP